MKRVTIYDVAKDSKVSLATVSRVINGSELVKEKTKKRVEESIKKLGYRPNAIAQALASSKNTNIALIMPELSSETVYHIINGIMDVSKIYRYNVMLHTFTEGINDLNEIVENILKSRVDGVIFHSEKMDDVFLEKLAGYSIKLVSIGKFKSQHAEVFNVFVDFNKNITHLLEKYRADNLDRILFFEDHKNPKFSTQLKEIFMKRADELGMREATTTRINTKYNSSYKYMKEYLKNHKHDVVITYRDSQALAVLNAARENGIQVPEQLQIICLQDSKYNLTSRPTISGFKNPNYDLGALSMRIMTKLVNDDDCSDVRQKRSVELSSIFYKRGSTL